MGLPARILHLASRYLRPGSSVSFWHTPLGSRFYDFAALDDYYIDFRAKTRYGGPFDDAGAPLLDYGGTIGTQANPCAASQYALGWFQLAREGDASATKRFLDVAVRLIEMQHRGGDRDGLWLYDFDLDAYGVRRPWASALAQAQAISVLVRAARFHRLRGAETTAAAGYRAMIRPIELGGLLRRVPEGIVLEEVAADRLAGILDGMMFAVFGVYDYAFFTGDREVQSLADETALTIERLLPRYDLGFWSRADLYQSDPPMIASAFYHGLHVDQLRVLAKLTGRSTFADYAARWSRAAANPLHRSRAFCTKLKFKLCHY